jgi:hypothetical protein
MQRKLYYAKEGVPVDGKFPLHEKWTLLNELMFWFKRTDIAVTDTAVDVYIPSPMRILGIPKFVWVLK